MRTLIQRLTIVMTLVLAVMPGKACHDALPVVAGGEIKAQETPPSVVDDYGFTLNAPAQVPALTPNPLSRVVTTVKYRTSHHTSSTRRNVNRLSDNLYCPIAADGRLVVERMTAPLRHHTRPIHFYVLELCRLLC